MADAVFHKLVDNDGLSKLFAIDSAGTSSWHVGQPAHNGTQRVLADHDIKYSGRSRQLKIGDLAQNRSYIIAMDQNNIHDIKAIFGDHPRLYRLLDFAKQSEVKDVPDPYYSDNFEYVYQLVKDGCEGLLAMIRDREGI
jgi:protein-tyrosine phosphatase